MIKKRHEIFYNEKSIGPFTVLVEFDSVSNLNVDKIDYMKIAKEIFDMKLNNIIRIRSKDNNKKGIDFWKHSFLITGLSRRGIKDEKTTTRTPKSYASSLSHSRCVTHRFNIYSTLLRRLIETFHSTIQPHLASYKNMFNQTTTFRGCYHLVLRYILNRFH